MRSRRQGKLGSGVDGLSWLLTSTLSLILIVCFISVAPHVPVSVSNSGQLFSSLPGKINVAKLLAERAKGLNRRRCSSCHGACLAVFPGDKMKHKKIKWGTGCSGMDLRITWPYVQRNVDSRRTRNC